MGPPTPFGLKSSPCPPLRPDSVFPRLRVPVAPIPWFRAPMYIYTLHPWTHGPSTMHPCILAPCTPVTMHPCTHATLLPCTVDAWVISHRHHDTMTHTHPCRSTTGLTATLTPVIHQPTSPINLPTPHQGSLLPFKPHYHRNHGNTHPMHPKPLNPSYQTGEKSLPQRAVVPSLLCPLSTGVPPNLR
jgi:hypothetical protein